MAYKGGGKIGNKNAEKYDEEFALELGEDLMAWLKELPSNIFFEEFFYFHRDDKLYPFMISRLSKKFESFDQLIKRAKKMQEIKLQKYAGSSILNAPMAIFCLKNHHKYRDRFDHVNVEESELTKDGDSLDELPTDKLIELEKTLEKQLAIMKGYTITTKKPDDKKALLKNELPNRKQNKKRSKKSKTTTRKKKPT